MIELLHFGKQYGDFTAVSDLSLKIEAGEMFGFIGPNGAGKSTTIRFLATLLRASSGEGRVNGHSVTQDPIGVRRSIGYMPDNFGVYDGMKVWEFLDFFAVAYQVPRARRKQVLSDVLELLDLTHKRDDFVNGLSRGMKQRLCLAKTLVHDPPVLILDEPASGLDPRARLEVKALLKELRSMGKDDSHLQPHPHGAGRLLHVDRHHRAGTPAALRPDPAGLQEDHPQPPRRGPLQGQPRGGGKPARQPPQGSRRPAHAPRLYRRGQGRRGRRRAPAAPARRRQLRAHLLRRERAHPRRRLHAGHQGVGDVDGQWSVVSGP